MDSQETVSISPEMYEEFIFPCYKKISEQYGLCLLYTSVAFAVAAKVMSGGENVFDRIGIGSDPASGHKKGGVHVFFTKRIEDFLRIRIPEGAVKAQRDLFLGRLHAAYGQLDAVYDIGGGSGDRFGGCLLYTSRCRNGKNSLTRLP